MSLRRRSQRSFHVRAASFLVIRRRRRSFGGLPFNLAGALDIFSSCQFALFFLCSIVVAVRNTDSVINPLAPEPEYASVYRVERIK